MREKERKRDRVRVLDKRLYETVNQKNQFKPILFWKKGLRLLHLFQIQHFKFNNENQRFDQYKKQIPM